MPRQGQRLEPKNDKSARRCALAAAISCAAGNRSSQSSGSARMMRKPFYGSARTHSKVIVAAACPCHSTAEASISEVKERGATHFCATQKLEILAPPLRAAADIRPALTVGPPQPRLANKVALILAYDRSRVARPDRRLGRAKGRIQAVGPRVLARRRPRAPSSPRAIGPAHRPRPARPARPRALDLPRARPPGRRRENLVAGRLDLHRDGYGFVRPNRKSSPADSKSLRRYRTSSFRPARSTPPCRATRFWSRSTLPKPMAASRAASCGFSSAATPPSSARFTIARRRSGRNNVVIPFDDRMTQPIVIPPGAEIPRPGSSTPHRVLGHEATPSKTKTCGAPGRGALEGLVVDVEITSWPTPTRPPSAASSKSSARPTTSASTWR
jgi:hypothetical protein